MTRDTTYTLPANIQTDWLRARTDGYQPNARQAMVVSAVRLAIETGRLKRGWSPELLEHVKAILKPTAKQLQSGTDRDPGGDFAADVHGALTHVIAAEDHALALSNWHTLKPRVGMHLGTMVMSQDRRLDDVTIIGFQGAGDSGNGKGLLIRIEGRAPGGACGQLVRMPTSINSIRFAIERAHARGLRATGFQEVPTEAARHNEIPHSTPARRAHRFA